MIDESYEVEKESGHSVNNLVIESLNPNDPSYGGFINSILTCQAILDPILSLPSISASFRLSILNRKLPPFSIHQSFLTIYIVLLFLSIMEIILSIGTFRRLIAIELGWEERERAGLFKKFNNDAFAFENFGRLQK